MRGRTAVSVADKFRRPVPGPAIIGDRARAPNRGESAVTSVVADTVQSVTAASDPTRCMSGLRSCPRPCFHEDSPPGATT